MKAFYFSLIILLYSNLLAGQNTFSYRFHFGFPAVVLTNIVATDSAYYALGVMADSVPPYKKSNLFLKVALEGEIQLVKTLRDTAKTYETWFGNMAFNEKGQLAASGYSFDSTSKSLLLLFDTEGDTILAACWFLPGRELKYMLTRIPARCAGTTTPSSWTPAGRWNGEC